MHRFAVATAFVTFLLLAVGGLVTSHEAGLAVVDWPNSYGTNMFLFPLSRMVGGIFYEHSHRLIGTLEEDSVSSCLARIWPSARG